MKNIKIILSILLVIFALTSCSEDDTSQVADSESQVQEELEVQGLQPVIGIVENLYAPASTFTKFSFLEGKKVTGDNWDIAFSGTKIIVNGGDRAGLSGEPDRMFDAAVAFEAGFFKTIKEVPVDSDFRQDKKNALAIPNKSLKGWFLETYDAEQIKPLKGKIFLIKTHNACYAKLEIISYYKDKADFEILYGNIPDKFKSFYTFNYAYNPNKGDTSFQ
ncbi:MAG: HmuY family protein [Tenacibaculum sp.]